MCLQPTTTRKDGSPLQVYWTCGSCIECYKKRALEWCTRVGHELASYDDSIFVTLTYDDKKLVYDSLGNPSYRYDYTDFQDFMKRLRQRIPNQRIRYFTSLEYGGKHGRLHFHAIIFNFHPSLQRRNISTPTVLSPSGYQLYHSSFLEELWPHGFHSFSDASVETAYYIASYALSDSTHVNDMGEILSDKLKCSQGIGLDFFIVHMDTIIAQAIHYKKTIPRYYRKKLLAHYPLQHKKMENLLTDLKRSPHPDDQYARIVDFEKKHKRSLFRSEQHFEFDDLKSYYRR